MKLRVLSAVFILLLVGVFSSFLVLTMRSTDLLESEARDLDQGARSTSTAQSIKSRLLIHNFLQFLLSTSRRIVEAHSGTLKVESQLGKGSIFYITLHTQLNPHPSPHLVEDQRI